MKPSTPRLFRIPHWLAAVAMLFLCTHSAQAHIVSSEGGGFAAGFKHPWSGWDHILAMVAVGIWGAQLGKPAIWLLPVTFPLVMSVGGFLGLMGLSASFHVGSLQLNADEVGIAFSMLALGSMVLSEAKPPLWVAAVLVGIFGLCHGFAHGKELPPGENGLLYSIGFVIATGTLHGVGIFIGTIHRWKAGRSRPARGGGHHCSRWCLFPLGRFASRSRGSNPQPKPRKLRRQLSLIFITMVKFGKTFRRCLLPGVLLLLGTSRAHAHLVTTGLGPVYDGITHFALSPDDILPALALALFAGLRGPPPGRRAMFAATRCLVAGRIDERLYY